jgi:hypothetical protein
MSGTTLKALIDFRPRDMQVSLLTDKGVRAGFLYKIGWLTVYAV